MGFDYNPLLLFVCRLCRQAFPSTDKLKTHKLENHLGDCLKTQYIIFEERVAEQDFNLMNQIFLKQAQSSDTLIQRNINRLFRRRELFRNPYVSLKQLSQQEIGSSMQTSNRVEFSQSVSKRNRKLTSFNLLQDQHDFASSKQNKRHNPQIQVHQTKENLTFTELIIPKEEPEIEVIDIPVTAVSSKSCRSSDDSTLDNLCNAVVLEDGELITASISTLPDGTGQVVFESTQANASMDFNKPGKENVGSKFSHIVPDQEPMYFKGIPGASVIPNKQMKFPPPLSNDKTKKKVTFSSSQYQQRAKPYQCRYCGRSFSLRGSVKDHERTHTGNRFKCTVGNCGAAFCSKRAQYTHNRTKHMKELGLKELLCPICGKAFGFQARLNNHIRHNHQAESEPFTSTQGNEQILKNKKNPVWQMRLKPMVKFS